MRIRCQSHEPGNFFLVFKRRVKKGCKEIYYSEEEWTDEDKIFSFPLLSPEKRVAGIE